MKVLLSIPSKNRVDTLQKYTLKWLLLLPKHIDWQVFVEPQDYEAYLAVVDKEHLRKLDENDMGLSHAKGVIKRYAVAFGYDFVWKIDDDIRGFSDFRKTNKPEETALFVPQLIDDFLKYFEKYPRLGAIGFPYRNEMFVDGLKQKKTKRLQTSYFIRTHLLYSNSDLKVFEDLANSIYVLTQGYQMVLWYRVGIDLGVDVGKGTGGIQSFDRVLLAERSFDILRQLYPPLLFRRVNKPWKIEPDLRSVKL